MSKASQGGTASVADADLGAVLILAPVGQDAGVIAKVLRDAAIPAQPVDSISAICPRVHVDEGVGVAGLIVTEEALSSPEETATLEFPVSPGSLVGSADLRAHGSG